MKKDKPKVTKPIRGQKVFLKRRRGEDGFFLTLLIRHWYSLDSPMNSKTNMFHPMWNHGMICLHLPILTNVAKNVTDLE